MDQLGLIPLLFLVYLIGSIPTGYLLARSRGVDIRNLGSGNVGATNVTRVLGKSHGALTLLIDVAKGFLAVLLVHSITGSAELSAIASVIVILGHCYSIPTLLPGGKGVASALGVTLFFNWLLGLASIFVFAGMLYASRIVSLSSVTAVLFVPVSALFLPMRWEYQCALQVCAAIVIYRHKENLARLTRGDEPSFKRSSAKASST